MLPWRPEAAVVTESSDQMNIWTRIIGRAWPCGWKLWLCCLAAGCASLAVPSRRLDQAEFLRLYAGARSAGDYWDYRGVSAGRHWLFHYGFKSPQQSVATLIERGFIPEAEMPVGFPSVAQPAWPSGGADRLKKRVEDFNQGANQRPAPPR